MEVYSYSNNGLRFMASLSLSLSNNGGNHVIDDKVHTIVMLYWLVFIVCWSPCVRFLSLHHIIFCPFLPLDN
jgi:hypothetical protein